MSEDPHDELPHKRVLLAAANAMRTNERNEGGAPQLFGVAILNLPFLLGTPESAAMVDEVEATLGCSLLELLAKGVCWYHAHAYMHMCAHACAHIRTSIRLCRYQQSVELLSSAMIALRQLLACWVANDDTADFAGVDEQV